MISDEGSEPERGRSRFGFGPPSRAQLVGLVLVLMYLAGAIGYMVGSGRPPGAESTDVGFLQDMTIHHDQAVSMANVTLAKTTEPAVAAFAREVLITQRYELGLMAAWLGRWGYRVDGERTTAMAWMGMPTPVAEMPGMASEVQMRELAQAEGRQVDSLFLTMMREHHRGGVEMASVAVTTVKDASVRALAATIARNQRIEMSELESARQRLGL